MPMELSITEKARCYFQNPAWFLIMESKMSRGSIILVPVWGFTLQPLMVLRTPGETESYSYYSGPLLNAEDGIEILKKCDLSSSAQSPLLIPFGGGN